MKIFRIQGKDDHFLLVNLAAVIFVDLNEEKNEIIFDGILGIKVEDKEFTRVQKEIWGKLFDFQ